MKIGPRMVARDRVHERPLDRMGIYVMCVCAFFSSNNDNYSQSDLLLVSAMNDDDNDRNKVIKKTHVSRTQRQTWQREK